MLAQMRRRTLILLLTLLLAGYSLLLLLLWLAQDQLVFPGAGRQLRPVAIAGVETIELRGPAGPFRVAEAVPERPRAVLLFFGGNAESLPSLAERAAAYARAGIAVVSPEYPGYGASAGRPGVASFQAMAEVAAAHARALATQRSLPLTIGGHSLGSFCAVHLAAAGLADRLLLLAPPTTLAAAAGHGFWWAPVSLLLRHDFDNLAVAGRVHCPALVLHGDADAIVPCGLGERLCAAFAGPQQFVRVPGAGHNDLPFGPEGPFCDLLLGFLTGK